MKSSIKVTVNLINSYLKGECSLEEAAAVNIAAHKDSDIRKYIDAYREYEELKERYDTVVKENGNSAKVIQFTICNQEATPISMRLHDPYRLAAKISPDDKECVVKCEKRVLLKRGLIENDMAKDPAVEEKIRQDVTLYECTEKGKSHKIEGVKLHKIGYSLVEKYKLSVGRRFDAKLEDIKNLIDYPENNFNVIAVIENPENKDNSKNEELHAVVVEKVDFRTATITLYDPIYDDEDDSTYTLPISVFKKLWGASHNFIVQVNKRGLTGYYKPYPENVSDVTLDEIPEELISFLYVNAHNVWARKRKDEKPKGWTYGPQRNDEKKETPDMVPYYLLPEGEEQYDKDNVDNTLKLIKKWGFKIEKEKDATKELKELTDRLSFEFKGPEKAITEEDKKKAIENYDPQPINTSAVELDDKLLELSEALAENSHEVWSKGRMGEGWTYGPQKDDENKKNHLLVPYCELSEEEKKYDRDMSMETLKLIRLLGYKIYK